MNGWIDSLVQVLMIDIGHRRNTGMKVPGAHDKNHPTNPLFFIPPTPCMCFFAAGMDDNLY